MKNRQYRHSESTSVAANNDIGSLGHDNDTRANPAHVMNTGATGLSAADTAMSWHQQNE
ncbi:hypothetical protein KC865_01255 [Candidatus Kaiserbacteria bacterium]|nr:hypothetical protein [Candidatus Kaiserbacteria bacterium]USN92370.1 MAG: hypothetical protein H6782_00965 [Candidatus Nomurabacteria bacterium]